MQCVSASLGGLGCEMGPWERPEHKKDLPLTRGHTFHKGRPLRLWHIANVLQPPGMSAPTHVVLHEHRTLSAVNSLQISQLASAL